MKTVGEILRLSVDHVQRRQGRPRREVEEWIAEVLGLKRLDLYVEFDRPIHEEELSKIRVGLSRLAAGEPLAYILKRAPFYGLEFNVSPSVLIPRPETEILVSVAREYIQKMNPGTIVDVCAGSGCIGLTLKTLFPDWHVVLIDISREALDIAKGNAQKWQLDVEILHGNLLEPFLGRKADCVVANPPYLSSSEWQLVDASVSRFEPQLALEAGPDGTEIFRRLFHQLPQVLTPTGWCAIEIGASQGPMAFSLARSIGFPRVVKDFSGKDRVVEVSLVQPASA